MAEEAARPGEGRRPAKEAVSVHLQLQPDMIEAIDAWIARHPERKLSRSEAVRQILAGALATQRPSTILPNFTTGRDIV